MLNKLLCWMWGHVETNYTLVMRKGCFYEFIDIKICKHCTDIKTLRSAR